MRETYPLLFEFFLFDDLALGRGGTPTGLISTLAPGRISTNLEEGRRTAKRRGEGGRKWKEGRGGRKRERSGTKR